MLVLKHTDALINLDMHQLLNSDPIKRIEPETGFVSTSANDGDRTHRSTSPRSNRISPACAETTQDGASTCRTLTTSWDHLSKPCNAMRMMRSSMVQLQQPNIQLGHHQPQATPRTSSPVSKPTRSETPSSHMVGQRSIISQPTLS